MPSTDDERELLEVLPLLKPFLVEDQPLAVRPPRFGRHRFAWSDERPRLVWSGCDVRYEDPSIRPFEVDLEVDLDEAAFETLESHFGVPPVVLGWYRIDDPRFRDAERTLLAERERLGACRGMRLTGRPAYVDPAWLVSQSAPHLAPLSQAILRVWRPVRNGPQYPAWLDGLTSFVQRAVPYRLIPDSPDGRYRGDVRTPGLTALLGGDCDSKSLLLAALIRAVDPNLPIALVLIRGVPIGHAMLAVGVPAADCAATVEAGGQVYVLIESTDGWGIGAASPEFRLSDVEEVIPIP